MADTPPISEEFPHFAGCLSWAVSIGGTWVVLLGISAVFGAPAAFWFGLGALIVCIIALWEAGAKALHDEAKGVEHDQHS